MTLQQKKAALLARIAELESVLVAFSGGVDSTLLLKLCHDVLQDRVVAVTATSALQPGHENESAIQIAADLGVRHISMPSRILDQAAFVENTSERCYHCKRHLFATLLDMTTELDLKYVAHGANVDDLGDYRPGFRAAAELGVVAPLLEAGLGKADIRRLSKKLNLSTWDKPAMACLATRIPYGTELSAEHLDRIDTAESALYAQGFRSCRVRSHGSMARIEVPEQDIERFLDRATRRNVVARLRAVGFHHVAVDLEGYRQGRMNRDLE